MIEASRAISTVNETFSAERALSADGVSKHFGIRAGSPLKILVDSQQVGEEGGLQPTDFNLSNGQPLQIGFGPNDYFRGRLIDVRLYRRALTAGEIAVFAKQ